MILYIKTAKWEDIKDWWKQNDGFKHDIPSIKEKFSLCCNVYQEYDEIYVDKEDKVFVAYIENKNNEEEIVGCVRILYKEYEGYTIGGLGKMCACLKYRRNNIASMLLEVCINYMGKSEFDVSILWASILKLYDNFGWVDIYKNMMIKYFAPVEKPKQYWIDSIKTTGTR